MKPRNRSDVLTKPTRMAELLLQQYIRPGDAVIDATCGNGYDTALLLELVGAQGNVYAFDVQQAALEKTREFLALQGFSCCDGRGAETVTLGRAVTLICDSHSKLAEYVKEPVQAVVFNLGYLPGGDKTVTTEPTETLAGLEAALELLNTGGVVVCTVYSGHDQGRERAAVLDFLKTLDRKKYHCVYVSMVNQGEYPPEVVAVVKK